jgi:hypothetical protein
MAIYYFWFHNLRRIRNAFRDIVFYLRHGFKRSDTWGLDTACAKWLIPRLRYFKEHHAGNPPAISGDEWTEIIGKMIRAFELIATGDDWKEGDRAAIQTGLDLFREYFQNLWD